MNYIYAHITNCRKNIPNCQELSQKKKFDFLFSMDYTLAMEKDCFGSRLREFRNSLNLSQKDFAKKLGIKQNVLSFYENDQRFPKRDFFEKLRIFETVDLNWLLLGKSQSPKMNLEPDIQELLFWVLEVPLARHAALAALYDLMQRYPKLFERRKT